jgi:type II secretory pathway component PulM
MRSLRALFLRIKFSEKLLLIVFVLLIVGFWFTNFNRRAFSFTAQARSTTNQLKLQQQWLDNRASIEEAAKRTAARLDPAKTLDGSALNAVVVGLASEAGLPLERVRTSDPQQETTGQFNVHIRTVRIDRAEWSALKKFYLSLLTKSPYIGIEQCTLIPDRANPGLINVTLRVSAPEVVR